MTDGLLDNIIELEKRIQADVTAEQARAEEWQARELAALQNACTDARRGEETRCQELLAEQAEQLKGEAKALELASAAWCQRLLDLDDKTLRDLLKQHLAAILPGGDYDHPHGQS